MAALQVAVDPSLPPWCVLLGGGRTPETASLETPQEEPGVGHTPSHIIEPWTVLRQGIYQGRSSPPNLNSDPQDPGWQGPLLSEGCEGRWWVLPLAVLTELQEQLDPAA